ncbi:MAG: serine/threonine-protein kinase [Myxococcota bacterium]
MSPSEREDVGLADTVSPPSTAVDFTRDDGPVPAGGDAPQHEVTGPERPSAARRPASVVVNEGDIGSTLGRYVVLGTLGKGGMGTVYKAFDPSLDRQVAVKVLRRRDGQGRHTKRLMREAQALAQLSHPNVVQVYEVGEVSGRAFVAMELVDGMDLRQWVDREPRPTWRQCIEVYLQAGQGLAAAHARGLVHRDFKPSNAVVDDQGRARVLDFGLVREATDTSTDADRTPNDSEEAAATTGRLGWDAPLTRAGFVMGTPAYMPLEQMAGETVDARGDQFSFCVALFEALYGQRPFEGLAIRQLRDAIAKGEIRPVPRESTVSPRVRRALVKGLSARRNDRFPSMTELLDELQAAVTPSTHRWLGLSLAVGVGVAGLVFGYRAGSDESEQCTGARQRLAEVWDEPTRARVRESMVAVELPYAEDTWGRVDRQLEDYASAWAEQHTETCEATRVTGAQTERIMELRMACLDERRTGLQATVQVLADADPKAVEKAVGLVKGLPRLARCEDLAALQAAVPPPEDLEVAAQVTEQRRRLTELRVMGRAGRHATALKRVEGVVERADALAYGPLIAEARLRRGLLRNANGKYAQAEQDLKQAYALALEQDHAEVASRASTGLVLVVGARLARHAEGLVWAETALPLARREGEASGLGGNWNNRAMVLAAMGDYEQAEHDYRRALEIWEEGLGADHPLLGKATNNLGNLLHEQGRYEGAEHLFRRARELGEAALGAEHPSVAIPVGNLAMAFNSRGRHSDAEFYYQRALEIQRAAFGEQHPAVAHNLGGLGSALQEQGRFAEAEVHHRRALEIREALLGPEHVVLAGGLINLGVVLEGQGHDAEAETQYRRALSIWEAGLGPDHVNLAFALNNLASLLREQGHTDEAEAMLLRAVKLREQAHGVDYPKLVSPLLGLGKIALGRGHHDLARAHAQRALEIRTKAMGAEHASLAGPLRSLATIALAEGEPEQARRHAEEAVRVGSSESAETTEAELARSRVVLARTLWSDPSQRTRAVDLVEQARAVFEATGAETASELADADQWLAEHPVAATSDPR